MTKSIQEKMYNITKFPVFILSSPRTGSTTLADDIYREYPNLKLFNESGTNKDAESFYEYIKNTNNYVLKAHLLDIDNKYTAELKDLISHGDAFLIRLRRRDIVAQVTSWYIEMHRKIFGYDINGDHVNVNDYIPLVATKADRAITFILQNNHILDRCSYNFDLDLYYEDLKLSTNKYIKTPNPVNYEKIYDFIKNRIGI
jgi:hypothetical protein